MRMQVPPLTQLVRRARTITPIVLVQPMATGGLLLFGVILIGPMWQQLVHLHQRTLVVPRFGGLKLEMPKEYINSRVPSISRWLLKMEWYFWLMNYLVNIWVDVVTIHIMDSA